MGQGRVGLRHSRDSMSTFPQRRSLQRHLQNMLFYHKGLRVRKKPLPFVACARKAAILRVQIWSAHSSDVVGLGGQKLS
jgi:hypothetical protein